MRIIAGRLGGRNFVSPRSHRTHPMSDKVRGALFNALGDIHGLSVLDAFAGSGALGFEAVSRGAKSVVLIENDKPAQRAIEESIEQLGILSQVRLIRANCSSWSDNNTGVRFDLVLLDPPYDAIRVSLLEKLLQHIKPGGILVLSWPGREAPPTFRPYGKDLESDRKMELLDSKQYGDAQLLFYRRAD